MRNLLTQSKIQLSAALGLIVLLNLLTNFSSEAFITIFLAVFGAVLSDFIFLKIRKVNLFFPSAAIATGLIIGLLTDPNLPVYIPLAISIVAMFSKNFIKRGRHIFNPASFGLMTLSLLGFSVSWWGVSWQIPELTSPISLAYFAILLLPAYVSMYKMKRWKIIFPFMLIYIVSQGLITKQIGVATLLDPTLIFFSIVMLPEPMTTPNNARRQIMFGGLIGLVVIFLSLLILPILNPALDPLILSLLIGNLIFFKYH